MAFRSKRIVRTSKLPINPLKTECRVIPIYNGGDRSVVTNYRPVSLTPPVVCQQKEHVIAGYLRQVWNTSKWLYEANVDLDRDTHAKAKYSQFVKDTAVSLDERARTDAIITDFSKAFDFVRVSGYRYRGLGFDSRRYQIF